MESERHDEPQTAYRSASVNAGIALTAFALTKPEIMAAGAWAWDKLTSEPEPSQIELPPGVDRE
jgi:hypothetical protein